MLISMLEHSVDWYFSCIPRLKPQAIAASHVNLIAHRGAHKHAAGRIENTDAAFHKALELGYWGIEFDVHPTADDVLVINHDSTLKRLWGHDLEIAQLNFNQLRALVPQIPTLSEVVETYGRKLHLFIELKCRLKDQNSLSFALKDLTPCKDYHILSLNAARFHALSSFSKQSLLLVPVHNNVKEFCELSLKENYGGVLGNYLLLTNALINKLNEADQRIGVGFVNSKYSLYRELNRGIRWVFTNNAEPVSQYLKELC
ncbi:MAG: glycerophosphodiester phosphodiesterase [Legionella sp.]|nr:glycerophosphodiester phosphodiesterase [Legionella sp.]